MSIDLDQQPSLHVRDAWLSVGALSLLLILDSYVLLPTLQCLFPAATDTALWYVSVIPMDLLLIGYLSRRNGRVGIADFVLGGEDLAVMIIAFIIVVIAFSIIWSIAPYQSAWLRLTISKLPRYERLITSMVIFLVGPFLEETLFRKYIYRIFRERYGGLKALAMTVVIETLVHIGYWDVRVLVMVFLSVAFLTVIYARSKLVVSIIMHCIINVCVYAF